LQMSSATSKHSDTTLTCTAPPPPPRRRRHRLPCRATAHLPLIQNSMRFGIALRGVGGHRRVRFFRHGALCQIHICAIGLLRRQCIADASVPRLPHAQVAILSSKHQSGSTTFDLSEGRTSLLCSLATRPISQTSGERLPWRTKHPPTHSLTHPQNHTRTQKHAHRSTRASTHIRHCTSCTAPTAQACTGNHSRGHRVSFYCLLLSCRTFARCWIKSLWGVCPEVMLALSGGTSRAWRMLTMALSCCHPDAGKCRSRRVRARRRNST
jgi:hypothetical protein